MECPKCGATVPDRTGQECPACGVILSKASRAFPRTYRPPAPTPPPPAEASSITWPRVLTALLVAGAIWYVARPGSRSSAVGGGSAEWYRGASGYERAVNEQKTTNGPVLVYFYTDWCGFCKRLEKDVLASPEFSKRYGSTVKVRLNPEEGRAERQIAEQYAIRGFPTMIVLKSSRNHASIVGYGGETRFYNSLDRALR